MGLKDTLIKKIKDKQAVVGIVGLGYVGLPLAVEIAKADYQVLGFDVQQEKVDKINKGENYIDDVVERELIQVINNGKLRATIDFSYIEIVDCVIICVPTPLDKHFQPNMCYIEKSTHDIAKYMKKGMLFVLESTTYPGTTEEFIKPILEKSGLQCNEDFYLAFSPERVDPGNKVYTTKNTPKVVGGIGKDSTEIAATLYRHVLEGEIHEVSSPAVAEMEKLLENTYRNINIGLANEMAILCNKMGIDIWEVIDAAKTKPYGFQAFYPGPGIGGHCIPIDPFYLSWKAREYDYHTKLIEVAAEINHYMPQFILERAMKILNSKKIAMHGAKILLLGVAYKPDIDDLRESPALKVIEYMEQENANIMYHDPYIEAFEHKGKTYQCQQLTESLLNEADLVVILTKHTVYDYQMIINHSSLLFDTKNATAEVNKGNKNVVIL